MDFNSSKKTPPSVSFMLGSGAPSPSPISSLVSNIKSPHFNGDSRRSTPNHSTFTPVIQSSGPILTPSGRNSSMVILSPSRTISESLTTLASVTAQQLEEVWDEVGYNSEERASQLSDLLVQFRDLCEAKIAEERGVAETFRQTIADAKEEIKGTAKALKRNVDPQLLKENAGQTLTDELASLEAAVEEMRRDAVTAQEDLRECRDQLVEAHDALGIEMNTKWRDIDSDLTMLRREEFHRKVSEMKESMSTRTSAIIQLLRDCQHFMKDLRIDTDESGSELDRRITGSLVRSKDGSYMMVSKFRTDACTGISSRAFDELTGRVTELSEEKRRRQAKLTELGVQICGLWEKLRIPEDEQRAFTESVQGLGMDTLTKGELELKRLSELKAKMLGKLVTEARQRIHELWDQTNATPNQRQTFEPMKVPQEELFNDDLLESHEEYIVVLEERLEQMKPIIKIIEQREEILEERIKYEELQKHSDRLQTRGAGLTKQLMLEEKMARRIKRELPKLTTRLERMLQEWQKVHKENFLYDGEVYLDAMARQEEEWMRYKGKSKSTKNQNDQASTENRLDSASHYRSLPGKKKGNSNNAEAKGKLVKPLVDARGKENVRAPSRGRIRG